MTVVDDSRRRPRPRATAAPVGRRTIARPRRQARPRRAAPGELVLQLRVGHDESSAGNDPNAAAVVATDSAAAPPTRLKQVRREMLADFCKMLIAEARLLPSNKTELAARTGPPARRGAGAAPTGSGVAAPGGGPAPSTAAATQLATTTNANPIPHLSPRMRQTLERLMAGDGEKQVALRLSLSQHTIHVYIKALYRSFGVNSRGELLARFLAMSGM